MLINKNILLKFLFLFILLLPAHTVSAQDSSTISRDQIQTSGAEDNITDKKKKKKTENEEDFFTFRFEKLSLSFFLRLMIDLISMIILIRLVYYPNYNKKDFFFTFFMFNLVMFMITYILK